MSVRDINCRLCLKVPHNEFVLIDETAREMLDVLSVKMDFDASQCPVMCEECATIVKQSLSFMSVCMDSEETIQFFDTAEDNAIVDLRRVYEHNSNELLDIHSKICRFCIKRVEDGQFIPLDILMNDTIFSDMWKKYMFQVDVNVTEDPLICFHCRDSLESYYKFLLNCRDTEEKINTYRQNEGTKSGNEIMLSNVFQQCSDYALEYPDRHIQVCEEKNKKPSMEEDEEIRLSGIYDSIEEFKEEFATEDERNRCLLYQNTTDTSGHMSCTRDMQDNRSLGCHVKSKEASVVTEDIIKMKPLSSDINAEFKIESEELHIKDEVSLNDSTHLQGNVSKFGNCMCNKKRKSCSKCNHKTETEVIMYKCAHCDYNTVYRHNFIVHLLAHKTEAEVTMYKCMICDFKTKHKRRLKTHAQIHRTEMEVTMYKCTACDFHTKYKYYLKKHMLIHKTEAEVKLYKCATCGLETKHKSSLKVHMLIHKTEAEVKLYKCATCGFETKHKSSLKFHMLIHRTEAEVTMYQCTACDFNTKYKKSLKAHALIHRTGTEVKLYKCATCDYKTKHKGSLKGHMLVHKTDAEVKWYKCATCDYKAKHKSNLNVHSLVHKTDAEIKWYKCATCDFKSKLKENLRGHMLIHRTEVEVTVYQCASCDFKTKHKKSLIRHFSVHKRQK